MAWIAITCLRLARWRLRARGTRNVPARGGAVVTWNHTSHVDFVVTAYEIYRRFGRPVRVLGRADLWDSWRTRWIVRFAGAVPVARSDPGSRASSYTAAVEVLQHGGLVMVAPEGGISTSFEVQPMRTGAARMAQQAGVPIVPSASWGSHRLVTTGYPFSARRAWGIPVEVAFAPPLHVGPDEDPVAATTRLQRTTTELLHVLQRSYPDGAPPGAWWVPARLGGSAPAPPADPGGPTTAAQPADPGEPTTAAQPTDPGGPTTAAQPADPGGPRRVDERRATGDDAAEPGSAP
ncbi:MAG: lysophospholipid acyltransferase family protein [Nitriliruptoraceae bacterium]